MRRYKEQDYSTLYKVFLTRQKFEYTAEFQISQVVFDDNLEVIFITSQ